MITIIVLDIPNLTDLTSTGEVELSRTIIIDILHVEGVNFLQFTTAGSSLPGKIKAKVIFISLCIVCVFSN